MDVGIISQLKKLKYSDILLMIKMMPVYEETLSVLLAASPSEDFFIKLLDLFAGQTVKFPPRTKLYHTIENINMYNHYMSKLNEDKPFLSTARKFNVTTQRVQSVVERIDIYVGKK